MTKASSAELTVDPACHFHLHLPPACSASLRGEPAFVLLLFINLLTFVPAAGWGGPVLAEPVEVLPISCEFLAPSPGEAFQVGPVQTQNLLEGLHFPSGPGTPQCCLSGPGWMEEPEEGRASLLTWPG